MKIYYAGYGFSGRPLETLYDLVLHRLISFAYTKDVELWLELMLSKPKPHDFLLDSGAYSAWRKGLELDLKAVGENCLAIREELVKHNFVGELNLINADVIPGTPNVPVTPMEVAESAKKSFENWKFLTSMDVPTLPVHHQGEPLDVLKAYLDEGCDYICISPANDKSKKGRDGYIMSALNLMRTNGFHAVKTHALGLTSQELLDRYDWYSVDSATCPINASFGKIFIMSSDGKLRLVSLTKRLRKHKGDMHFDFMPELAKGVVRKQVEDAGLSVEFLAKDQSFVWRVLFNLCTYRKYEDIRNHVEPGKYRVELPMEESYENLCGSKQDDGNSQEDCAWSW